MDTVIWVEVLSRHRHVLARERCGGRVVRVGRAYTNDVVVDDPYVAPEHIHILRDEDGGLIVEDLGSANGLFADRGRRPVARLVLGDDEVFRIGHTWLRVRTSGHRVAAERIAPLPRRRWPALVAVAAAVLGLAGALISMTDYSEPRIADYVAPLVALALIVAIWSALWAVASRIFAGQARFEEHLLVGLAAAAGFELWYALSEWAAFAFSSPLVASYRYVGFWCILALAGYIHLRRINPGRALLKAGVMAALLALAVAVEVLLEFDPRSGLQQHYVSRLLPPSFRLAPAANEASFFSAVAKLQGELDADRAKAP